MGGDSPSKAALGNLDLSIPMFWLAPWRPIKARGSR
jgi:hypothetical protein